MRKVYLFVESDLKSKLGQGPKSLPIPHAANEGQCIRWITWPNVPRMYYMCGILCVLHVCHMCNTCVYIYQCITHVLLHMCRVYTCITHVIHV